MIERRRLILTFGATLVLTPRAEGMKGSIAKAQQLIAETPGSWMAQQFENPANIEVHVRTTAREILADFPGGLDVLITGVGTGGHITGCARVLKKQWPQFKVFAVEPAASSVISGGTHSPHLIQGIGAGFIPRNLDTTLLDGVIKLEAETAKEMARRAAREEGMLIGISSGATLAAMRRNCRISHRAAACSASTTIPASGICRSKGSCRSNSSPDFARLKLPLRCARICKVPTEKVDPGYPHTAISLRPASFGWPFHLRGVTGRCGSRPRESREPRRNR